MFSRRSVSSSTSHMMLPVTLQEKAVSAGTHLHVRPRQSVMLMTVNASHLLWLRFWLQRPRALCMEECQTALLCWSLTCSHGTSASISGIKLVTLAPWRELYCLSSAAMAIHDTQGVPTCVCWLYVLSMLKYYASPVCMSCSHSEYFEALGHWKEADAGSWKAHMMMRYFGMPDQEGGGGSTWSWRSSLRLPGQWPGWQSAQLVHSGHLIWTAAPTASSQGACC